VLKSSVLFGSSSPVQKWTELLDLIFKLAAKKAWLREECGWVVYSSVLELPSKVHDSKFAEVAIEQLNTHQLTRTLEGVAIWILAKRSFPTMKFPRNVWHHDDPLNSRDRQILAKVMKEASVTDGEATTASKTGSWSPRLHFAWGVVLEEFYEVDGQPGWNHKSHKSKRLNFVEFWEAVVDSKFIWNVLTEFRLLTLRR